MIKLIAADFDQISILEYMLEEAKLPFERLLEERNYGLTKPYLIVDGVPIDMDRAINWIKEQCVYER